MDKKVKQIFVSTVNSAHEFDETILDYIASILQDDSLSAEDCVGMLTPYLMEAEVASDDDQAAEFCNKLFSKLAKEGISAHFLPNNPQAEANIVKSKDALNVLAAPVNLSQAVQTLHVDDKSFDWMKKEAKNTLVNVDQLQALETKREKKKEKKAKLDAAKAVKIINESTSMQSIHPEEGVQNRNRDIRMENFSLSLGKEVLMEDCSLTMAFGRRYGLVGRNGSGKSTLLKAISGREVDGIPSHLRILHVEQEVHGDDTTCLDCVLACDVERTRLLREEQELLKVAQENPKDEEVGYNLQRIHKRLETIESHTAEARASTILAGLSFTPAMQKRPTKEYSGGWRMRIALARALFSKPDVLLLDEPTNHLDLYSLLWLEDYLEKWPGTILVVSHQREFLNSVATDIVHLFNKKLEVYKGNYNAFERVRDDRIKLQQRQFESQQKSRKHIQAFIDRFRYNANRAALVQSRVKALERMEVIDEVLNDPTVVLKFPEPEPMNPPILQFRDVSFGFDEKNILFHDLNLGIDMQSRVALVGANGVGKSTLLNLMAGDYPTISGTVIRHPKLRFARFSQHFVDQLDLNVSAVDQFLRQYPNLPLLTVRNHLGSFGLSGDIVLRTINTLSGGQKSRLVFALLSWRKPHVLLLDEPTNHLDIETIDALAAALLSFEGGVLLVSHDERLITMVCDQLWYLNNGTVQVLDGCDFEEYKRMLLKKMSENEANSISL